MRSTKLATQTGSYFYHKDGLGSILDVTDGNQVQHYSYSSFGRLLSIKDSQNVDVTESPILKTSFTYTNREYDSESGMYYYRARYYDAKVGRFMQEDPHPGVLIYPSTYVSSYIYVLNNPINGTDPKGEILPAIVIGAIIGALANAYFNRNNGHSLLNNLVVGAAVGGLSAGVGAGLSAGISWLFGAGWTSSILGGAAGGAAAGATSQYTTTGKVTGSVLFFGALLGAVGGAVSYGISGTPNSTAVEAVDNANKGAFATFMEEAVPKQAPPKLTPIITNPPEFSIPAPYIH